MDRQTTMKVTALLLRLMTIMSLKKEMKNFFTKRALKRVKKNFKPFSNYERE